MSPRQKFGTLSVFCAVSTLPIAQFWNSPCEKILEEANRCHHNNTSSAPVVLGVFNSRWRHRRTHLRSIRHRCGTLLVSQIWFVIACKIGRVKSTKTFAAGGGGNFFGSWGANREFWQQGLERKRQRRVYFRPPCTENLWMRNPGFWSILFNNSLKRHNHF